MRAHRQRDALLGIAEDLDLPPQAIDANFSLNPKTSEEELGGDLRRVGLVGAGHLSLGDIEWVEPDGWAENLDHSIWLTVTEPSRLSP
jgi:hypothetical protein